VFDSNLIKRLIVTLSLVFLVTGFSSTFAAGAQNSVDQNICINLALETQKVLEDTETTSKYLSPYIADEIYQQVLSNTILANQVNDLAVDELPRMANLPCADTVSGFMMAIKKRMEYNRVDHFIVGNRVPLTVILIVFVLIVYLWRRFMPIRHKPAG